MLTSVNMDSCQKNRLGNGPVRKAMGFPTNSPCIAMELQKKCPNRSGQVHHRHVTLEGGRTKSAQVYPEGLCRAIGQGLTHQLEVDKKGKFMLAKLGGTEEEMHDVQQQLHQEFPTAEEDDEKELTSAWDDVTGGALDPEKVKAARQE